MFRFRNTETLHLLAKFLATTARNGLVLYPNCNFKQTIQWWGYLWLNIPPSSTWMNRAWPSIGSLLLSRMFLGSKRLLTHRGLRNENILLFWYVFKKAQFYTQEENIANRVWLEPECCLVIVAKKSHKKINTQLWWLSIGMSDHYNNFLTLVF